MRIGLVPAIAAVALYLAMDRGYIAAENLDLDFENLQASSEAIAHVAVAQLELASATIGRVLWVSLFVATLGCQAAAPPAPPSRAPGSIRSDRSSGERGSDSGAGPERRRGRVVASRALGERGPAAAARPTADRAGGGAGRDGQRGLLRLERALERGGLTRDDVELTYLSFPDINTALANRAVDAGWQAEPLLTLAAERGIARRFVGGDELYPDQQLAAVYYSSAFAARTEAAQRFMVAYVRAVRDYNDAFAKGIDRAAVVQILAQYTAVKDLALYDKLIPSGLEPDGRLNVESVRDYLAVRGRLGCLTAEAADISQVIDESFVNYALVVLGPYAR